MSVENEIETILEKVDIEERRWNEEIDDIKNSLDQQEKARRNNEITKEKERYEIFTNDDTYNKKKKAYIDLTWEELRKINTPLELNDSLLHQKEICNHLLESKNRSITELQSTLQEKQSHYVQSLDNNGERIKDFLSKANSQYEELKNLYTSTISDISRVLDQDISNLMEEHRGTTSNLFAQRQKQEEQLFGDRILERLEEYENETQEYLNEGKVGKEHINNIMRNAIEELQSHMVKMNIIYQLNKEKLDYNVKVLAERQQEFKTLINYYKVKLNHMNSTLINCIIKYKKEEEDIRMENVSLTGEYKRIGDQVKMLQKKLVERTALNRKRYVDAWGGYEGVLKGLVAKLLSGVKVVDGQVLNYKEEEGGGEEREERRGEERRGEEREKRGMGGRERAVMKLLVRELAFLFDAGSREEIRRRVREEREEGRGEEGEGEERKGEEERVFEIECGMMREFLKIENEEDMGILVKAFYVNARGDMGDMGEMGEERRGEIEDFAVDIDDCLLIVKQYLIHKETRRLTETTSIHSPTMKRDGKKTAKGEEKRGEEKRGDAGRGLNSHQMREIEKREEKKYWDNASKIISPSTLHSWEILERLLVQYLENLQKRHRLVKGNKKLKTQNNELMVLLDQFIHAPINQQLIVPPKNVIRIS